MQSQFKNEEELNKFINSAKEKVEKISKLDKDEFYMFLEYTVESILDECGDVFLKHCEENNDLMSSVGQITDKTLILMCYIKSRSAGGTDDMEIIKGRTLFNMEHVTRQMYESAIKSLGENK